VSKTSKTGKTGVAGEEPVLDALRDSLAGWASALHAHRLAPPDSGFSARLHALADAASEQARAYRTAAPDYEWAPYTAGQPPYELQPDTGRRGPPNLWQDFDHAVQRLGAATEGQDMLHVAQAYEDLADAASQLARAVKREDTAAQRAPARPRARRSA
jgi:hypothetical protein